MSGRILITSLTRRRHNHRLVFARVFSQFGSHVLSIFNSVDPSEKSILSRYPGRAIPCWFFLSQKSFCSAYSEGVRFYDEGLGNLLRNQHSVEDQSHDPSALQEGKVFSPEIHKDVQHTAKVAARTQFQLCRKKRRKYFERELIVQSGKEQNIIDHSGIDCSVRGVTLNSNDTNEELQTQQRERDEAFSDMKGAFGDVEEINENKEKKVIHMNDKLTECVRYSGLKRKHKSISHNKSDKKTFDFSDVDKVYELLLEQTQSVLKKNEKDGLAKVFKHFRDEGWASEQALRQYHIGPVLFPQAVARFRKFFFSKCPPELREHILQLGPSPEADQLILPLLGKFSSTEFSDEIARYKVLAETADLTKPHTWFPLARAMKRRIIYHSGPTNSGKTFNALQRFKAASSGIYCGPLRLLAMEVYDNVNADGVYCSLITGQERKEVPFATHVACTVEMVSMMKSYEVAILDEIQMITDEYRGWAWTRAFLGVPADEVHVCGDPSALKLIRELCAVTGDDFEEYSYERFEPLSIDDNSLGGRYGNIKPGDCIVSFSRRDIFSIKRSIEMVTKNRCCVIYGALPPETRRHQAQLFNDPNSGYDVLVATDAVGMGLNLNIRRVIFHSIEKYTGTVVEKVPASHVKQIAGRAGRRGTMYEAGIATTFFSKDMPYLLQCMSEPFGEAHSAGLFPGFEQIELFASQLPEATLAKLFDRFAESCRVDGSFFLCNHENLKQIAGVIDKVKDLTLEDKMSFILAPVNSRNPKVVGALLSFALAYSRRLPVHLAMGAPTESARSVLQLMDLEARHHVLSLYLYLSQRLPEEYFPQKEQAEQMAADVALVLGQSLVQTNIKTMHAYPTAAQRKLRKNKSPQR